MNEEKKREESICHEGEKRKLGATNVRCKVTQSFDLKKIIWGRKVGEEGEKRAVCGGLNDTTHLTHTITQSHTELHRKEKAKEE